MGENLRLSITKSTLIIILLTFLGYATGFFTQIFLAKYIGVGPEMDAFVTVSIIPEFVYGITNAILLTGFVILFSEYALTHTEKDVKKIIAKLFSFSFVILCILSLIALLFSKKIIMLMSPGFIENQLNLASTLLKLFSLSIILFGLSSLMTGILTFRKRFFATKIFRILISLGLILGIIIFQKQFGIKSLVVGTTIGVVIACVIQYYFIKKENFSFSFDFHSDPFFKKLIIISFPLLLGSIAYYFTKTGTNIIASLQGEGIISSFNYALLLVNVPIIFFCQAISLALFPHLTEKNVIKDKNTIKSLMSNSFGIILVLMAPITCIYFFLSPNIISLLFERGEFTKEATIIVANFLKYLALGVIPMGLYSLITTFFYSTNKLKEQVLLQISLFVGSIGFMLLFVKYYSSLGLAIGTTLAFWVINCVALYYIFKEEYLEYPYGSIIKIFVSSIFVAIFIYTWKLFVSFSHISTILCIISAIVLYVLTLYLQKSQELIKIYSLLKKVFV